tara:strand:+ start:73 stop:2187 length:2115 start_codon:yes stop_codon:yes gene_type:complete
MKKVKRNQDVPVLKNFIVSSLLCFSTLISSSYIYEGNQSLIDLTNQTGTTNLNSGDDQLSAAFNLDNSFTFYGNTYDSARMATNGCLHFGLGTGNVNYNNYCGDYTPDPLPQYTNTLFPFWTDLIRGNQSKMLAKNFNDKAVFGWYDMREYNRPSDNSFEVILWTNNTFEYRYGELDIINHDVLIGEQGSTSQYYQYLFHDECNTGTTNITGTCVNTNWNGTASNTSLENGGSLYGVGSGNAIDCSDPLNDASCAGYAAAYLTQQCDLDSLYDMACPSYWEAYDDQQCDEDPQYAPFCAGYQQEQSIAYFVEDDFDYGYEEEYFEELLFEEEWYEEPIDDYVFVEPDYEEEVFVITFNEPYEDEVYFEEIFIEESLPVIEEEYLVSFERIDEPVIFAHTPDLVEVFEFEIIREEIENELRNDERNEEEIVEALEEIQEENEIMEEEAEQLYAEAEEVYEEESEEINNQKSSVRISALEVVASTIRTARDSVSSSIDSSGATNRNSGVSSVTSSLTGSSASSISSTGGISTTNSPSISDQVVSASAQNQQVLSMSSDIDTTSTSVTINIMPDIDGNPQVAMADVQVQDMQGEIDTAISGVMTASEADQVAEQIIANNIKEQQEQAEQQQEETGQYADSTTLVAYLGYVAGFDAYRQAQIPQQETWYKPKSIYAGVMLGDNTRAFSELAGTSIETLGDMINMQPNL